MMFDGARQVYILEPYLDHLHTCTEYNCQTHQQRWFIADPDQVIQSCRQEGVVVGYGESSGNFEWSGLACPL